MRLGGTRESWYTDWQMKKAFFIVPLCVVTLTALARTPMCPVLPPPSPYADTESVTNVTFGVGVLGDNVFALSLELDATPSNNVEVAFGSDTNGNGTLDDSEASFALGWDCGEWFFRDIAADVADSYVGSCGRKKLDWNLSLDQSLAPKALRANAGGAALPFIMTATMYDPSWDVARVTVRGFGNAEAVLKFGATKEPLVIRIR